MVATVVVPAVFNLINKKQADRLEADNAILVQKLLQAQQAGTAAGGPPAGHLEIFDWDIKAMQKKGLKDPVNDIVSDLKQNGRLIPYKPTMGGTMNFYDSGKIWLLTGKWVFAYFENGHNGGYALLEYEVAPGGKISWKIIASYLA